MAVAAAQEGESGRDVVAAMMRTGFGAMYGVDLSATSNTELLDAINEQACDGHQLTWKVMRDRLRHLEDVGYVSRREVRRFPRETHYWATEFARRLVAELATLDAWYTANAPAPPVNTGPPDGH